MLTGSIMIGVIDEIQDVLVRSLLKVTQIVEYRRDG